MPEPPRFAPVDALLPPVEPSVSQYRVPARAGPPNSDNASMAEVTTAPVRSTFSPPFRFAMRLFKIPLPPGLGMTTDSNLLLTLRGSRRLLLRRFHFD